MAADVGVPKSRLCGAGRVNDGVGCVCNVGIWRLDDNVDGVGVERETCWFPKGVDVDEPGCGANNEPKKASGFSGRDVELVDDELDDGFVPDVVVGDDVPGVTELEEALSSVADPVSGVDAAVFDDALSSATAIAGLLTIAVPMPSATANAPNLPTNRAVDGVLANGGVLSVPRTRCRNRNAEMFFPGQIR